MDQKTPLPTLSAFAKENDISPATMYRWLHGAEQGSTLARAFVQMPGGQYRVRRAVFEAWLNGEVD